MVTENTFLTNPHWPEPKNLAHGIAPPPLNSREDFIHDAVSRFGDDAHFASQRWNAARRMVTGGDFQRMGEPSPDTGQSTTAGKYRTARILAAWLLTPREAFVPQTHRSNAYRSVALPLDSGQTISAPYMVSRMSAVVDPDPETKLLEIGTGSGYQAAVLAALSENVYTVETVSALAVEAAKTLEALSVARSWLASIRRRTADGYRGWEEAAPFHRIIVTCAINHLPKALLEQLAPGGTMIVPLGPADIQSMVAVRRLGSKQTEKQAAPPNGVVNSVSPMIWIPASQFLRSNGLKIPDHSQSLDEYEIADVYGNGTRVRFVPFVY